MQGLGARQARWVRIIVLAGSAIGMALCIVTASTTTLYVAYAMYILTEGCMYAMIAFVSAQLAHRYDDTAVPPPVERRFRR